MKNLLAIISFYLCLLNNIWGQYYVNLGDSTGLDISFPQNELNNVAHQLADSFPLVYQDSFKVFSAGFYTLNKNFQDGYDPNFQGLISRAVLASPYYILFARLSDEHGLFNDYLVNLKLPNQDSFMCLTLLQKDNITLSTKNICKESINQGLTFSEAEIKAMEYLKVKIKEITQCCDTSIRAACYNCLSLSEIKAKLLADKFKIIPITYIDEPPVPLQNSSSRSNSVVGRQNEFISLNSDTWNTSEELVNLMDSIEFYGLTSKTFVTSNLDCCQQPNDPLSNYDDIKELYSTSNENVKIWWHIWDDPSSDNDILFEKIEGINTLANSVILSKINEISNNSATVNSCHSTNKHGVPTTLTPGDYDGQITATEGVLAHYIIETYYKAKQEILLQNVEVEYSIPGSSSQGTGNVGFADIVNITLGDIFEIKTVRNWDRGNVEVELYVSNANAYCDPPIWGPYKRGGLTYDRNIDFNWWTPNRKLKTYLAKAGPGTGVIVYDLVPNEGELVPDPVYIPDIEKRRIDILIKDMVKNPSNALTLANDFLNKNQDLIDKIIFINAAGMLVAAGILVLSGGSAAFVEAPYVFASATLLIAAITFDPETYNP